MPVISRERIPFKAKDGSTEFVRLIEVNSVGTFSIDLPADVTEALDESRVVGYSRKQVLDAWNDALGRFHVKKAVTKKIIAYNIALKGDFEAPDGRPVNRSWRSWQNNGFHSPGAGLCIAAAVFNETTVTDHKKNEQCRYEPVPSTIPPSITLHIESSHQRNGQRWSEQMDWTAEREAFFVRVAQGLERLIGDLCTKFEDSKKVTKLADGKVPFLQLR